MKQRYLTVLALISVMTVMLSGCQSTDSTQETEKPMPVTLNVTTTYAGEDGNALNFQKAVQAWEEKTGNHVSDRSQTSGEDFKYRVVTDFETGMEPDVLFFFTGVDANSFVKQGKVVSIDEIRKQYPDYAKNMIEKRLPKSPVDGKAYAVPVNGYWEGMFVNKEVLKKAKAEMPTKDTTWKEFLDICSKVKKAGYTPIAASLQQVPHYWFEYAAFNNGTLKNHAIVPKTVQDTSGRAWVDGLEDIKTLYKKGFYPKNTCMATDDETFRLFATDQAAFLIDGSWKVGALESEAEEIDHFTVTHVPAKKDRKATEAIGGISSGYYITRKAWDHPEKRAAAVDFITYMTSNEIVSEFAGSSVTALKEGVSTENITLSSLGRDAVAFVDEITGFSPAVQDALSESQREPIFMEMNSIVKGKTSPQTAVEQVLERILQE